MAVLYSMAESNLMRERRASREGVELVRCSDGLWRTENERSEFEARLREQCVILSQRTVLTRN